MDNLKHIIKRARRFPPSALVRETGRSRSTVYMLLSGKHTNLLAETLEDFTAGVFRLEAAETKKKNRNKTAKKETRSRDTVKRSVA